MNKLLTAFIFFTLCACTLCFADDQEQVLTLKDGSQIKGVLSGVDNGVYTVKTPIIGDVHVAASDVASITNPSAASSAPAANNNYAPPSATSGGSTLDQQVAVSQQKLMSDPHSMQILQQMMQDPEIMQALQDPALVQAVTNHDYQAVQSNPAVQKLMGNPHMQELLKQLQQQSSN